MLLPQAAGRRRRARSRGATRPVPSARSPASSPACGACSWSPRCPRARPSSCGRARRAWSSTSTRASSPALRERKQPDEVAALREAGRLADEMVAWVAAQPLAGLTERQLAGRMQARFLEQGHPPHPDFIVATGANAALPHHETGDTPIDPRAPLLLDFGCLVDGYHSDITRVLLPERPAAEVEEAYAVVLAAHDAALAAVAPGRAVRGGRPRRARRDRRRRPRRALPAPHGPRRSGSRSTSRLPARPATRSRWRRGTSSRSSRGSTWRASSGCASRRSTTSARTARRR